jgi:hypothetical protein
LQEEAFFDILLGFLEIKTMKHKKLLIGLLSLTVLVSLGGVWMTQSQDQLQGKFSIGDLTATPGSIVGLGEGISLGSGKDWSSLFEPGTLAGLFGDKPSASDITQSGEELVTYAQEKTAEIQGFSEAFTRGLETATTAYDSGDATTVSMIQGIAESNLDLMREAMDTLKAVQEKADLELEWYQNRYDYVYDTFTEWATGVQDAYAEYNSHIEIYVQYFPEYYEEGMTPDDLKTVWKDLQKAHDDCLSSGGSNCDQYTDEDRAYAIGDNNPTIDQAEEYYDIGNMYYSAWQENLIAWESYGDSVTEYRKELSVAQGISDSVATELATAQSVADAAVLTVQAMRALDFNTCKSLTLTPDSYAMSADESSADFSFKITVEAKSSDPWVDPLALETSSHGSLTYDGESGSPLSIDMGSETEFEVGFEGGSVGEKINVSVGSDCSETLEITQSEAIPMDTLEAPPAVGIEVPAIASATGETVDTTTTDDESTDTETETETDTKTDTDTDGDKLSDSEEASLGTSPTDTDSDDDKLSDYDEVTTHKTDPTKSDADGDKLTDYWEVYYKTDSDNKDSDGDGTDDYTEVAKGTDPNSATSYPSSTSTSASTSSTSSTATDTSTGTSTNSSTSSSYDSNPFTDVSETDWYYDNAIYNYEQGYIKGTSEGIFSGSNTLNRAQAITAIVRLSGTTLTTGTGGFGDVKSSDWFSTYVATAESEGWIDGDYFNPSSPITRGDFILWLVRSTGKTWYGFTDDDLFDDVKSTDSWAWALAIAKRDGVLEGYDDNTARPYKNLKRAELAAFIERAATAW